MNELITTVSYRASLYGLAKNIKFFLNFEDTFFGYLPVSRHGQISDHPPLFARSALIF